MKETGLIDQIYKKLEDSHKNILDSLKENDLKHILQEIDIYEAELLAQNQELLENEQALKTSNELLNTLFENAPISYIILNDRFEIYKYNSKADKTFNIKEAELKVDLFLTHLDKSSISKFIKWVEHDEYHNKALTLDMRTNKGVQKFKIHAQNYPNPNKKWLMLSFTNIDKEYHLKEQIKQDHQYLQNIINGMQDPLRVIDKDYNIILMNEASENMINEEFMRGRDYPKCYKVSHHSDHPCSGGDHACPMETVLKTNKPYTTIHKHFDKENNPILEQVTISPLKESNGNTIAFIEHCHNVTELIEAQEKLHQQKYFDQLTTLPNRGSFTKQLEETLELANRYGHKCSLILVDIKNFKAINESFGHEIGDQVIKDFARSIQECIHKGDSVFRLTGDSFAVLLHEIEDNFSALRLLEALNEKLKNKAIEIMFNNIHISFSAGIANYPDDGNSNISLFKNAESALNEAKRIGANYFKFYSEELTNKALDRIIYESTIKTSLKENKFDLYFQPQYDSKTNTLIGSEALIRWKEGPQGIISPDKFIPHVESTGLMHDLGYWIIKNVFESVVSWQNSGYNSGRTSLNISLIQLKDENFIEKIQNLLEETNCDPKHIGIEITESTLMDSHEYIIGILNRLSKLGFYLLIDDFGTGYSSLAHLKDMPVQKLKIDKSFIDGVPHKKDDCVIAKTIIDLAINLEMDLIAEGVETKEQIEYLKELGCTNIQGYYYSKPLSKEEIEELYKTL